MAEKQPVYRINYLAPDSRPDAVLNHTPIPGEARMTVLVDEFPTFAEKLIEDLKALTGKEEKEQIMQVFDRIGWSFYRNHRKELTPYCLTISKVATLAGLKQPGGSEGLLTLFNSN